MKSLIRSWKHGLLSMAIVVGVLLPATTAQSQARTIRQARHSPPFVFLQKIGNPAWTPTDVHVFSAPIGTASDGYAEFAQTGGILLPPPHYEPNPALGIGPGTPEPPPYNHDLADGLAKAGYLTGPLFLPQQFSNGSGVYLVYMVVPSAGSRNFGSSPDFTRGPIIPNSLFPINVTGITYRNFAVYNPYLASFNVPALNSPIVVPPFNVDGSSHFPIFIADNSDFGPPGTKLPGLYSYQLTMHDGSGNGWTITAFFLVV